MASTIAKCIKNEKLNGIELYFAVYPLASTITMLKQHGYRWNHKKSCWYAKDCADSQNVAYYICKITLDEYKIMATKEGVEVKEVKQRTDNDKVKAPKNKTTNKFGVSVGDIFQTTWGYDETHSDWYKVVALVGEKSVRVVEVQPERIHLQPICQGSYKETLNLKNCVILKSSLWIEDQVNGDLKRLNSFSNDIRQCQFTVHNNSAYKVFENVVTVVNDSGFR